MTKPFNSEYWEQSGAVLSPLEIDVMRRTSPAEYSRRRLNMLSQALNGLIVRRIEGCSYGKAAESPTSLVAEQIIGGVCAGLVIESHCAGLDVFPVDCPVTIVPRADQAPLLRIDRDAVITFPLSTENYQIEPVANVYDAESYGIRLENNDVRLDATFGQGLALLDEVYLGNGVAPFSGHLVAASRYFRGFI